MKHNMKSLCFLEQFKFFVFLRLCPLLLVCCVPTCTVEVGTGMGTRLVFP